MTIPNGDATNGTHSMTGPQTAPVPSMKIDGAKLGLQLNQVNGASGITFTILDDASVIRTGSCTLKVPDGGDGRKLVGVSEPCIPSTFQYAVSSWNAGSQFSLNLSHTYVISVDSFQTPVD